jgi:hypothetical protein
LWEEALSRLTFNPFRGLKEKENKPMGHGRFVFLHLEIWGKFKIY